MKVSKKQFQQEVRIVLSKIVCRFPWWWCTASCTVFPSWHLRLVMAFCVLLYVFGPDCSRRQLLLVFYSSSVTGYLRRHLSRSRLAKGVQVPTYLMSTINMMLDCSKIITIHLARRLYPYPICITFVYRNNLRYLESKTGILLLAKGSKIYSCFCNFSPLAT